MKARVILFLVAFIAASPAGALADDASREFRRGFTFGYQISSGWERVSLEDLPRNWVGGRSLFQFALGAFVNPDLAIGVKSTGLRAESRFFDASEEIDTLAELTSLSVQFWRYAPIKLEAGIGVSRFDSNAILIDRRVGEPFFDLDYGWGLYAGTSIPLARRGAHRLELGFQWTYMSFEYQDVQQLAIQLGYQLF